MTKRKKKNKIVHNPITYNFTKKYISELDLLSGKKN